jgi:hypothetical protein
MGLKRTDVDGSRAATSACSADLDGSRAAMSAQLVQPPTSGTPHLLMTLKRLTDVDPFLRGTGPVVRLVMSPASIACCRMWMYSWMHTLAPRRRGALAPGCPSGYVEGCHVGLHSLPGVGLVTWTHTGLHSLPGVRLVTWTHTGLHSLPGVRLLTYGGLSRRFALTPGCPIGQMDRPTGCHQYVCNMCEWKELPGHKNIHHQLNMECSKCSIPYLGCCPDPPRRSCCRRRCAAPRRWRRARNWSRRWGRSVAVHVEVEKRTLKQNLETRFSVFTS